MGWDMGDVDDDCRLVLLLRAACRIYQKPRSDRCRLSMYSLR